ncbi:MAG: hypothetical protein KC619_26520 [Myxococcales bacterium]|nr:hypothetical protein [Myxococcales bacterium]
MGHRANFVIIEDGEASAYVDGWAALGCTFAFAEGPRDAATGARGCEPTDELLPWAFAEAGYLIDHDQRVAIVFGVPDYDPQASDDGGWHAETWAAIEAGPEAFLRQIAPAWSGWTLWWDDRGTDAFADHLAERGITSIAAAPPTDRRSFERVRLDA